MYKQFIATAMLLGLFITMAHADTAFKPDQSFGKDGSVELKLSDNDSFRFVKPLPDGKILIAGTSMLDGTDDFALVKLNADGSLDSTFGYDGAVTTDFLMSLDLGKQLLVQPDGKYVLVGEVEENDDDGHRAPYRLGAARYLENGRLDRTFGTGGRALIRSGESIDAADAALDSQSRIVVASFDFTVRRINADGSLDKTFGKDGIASIDMSHRHRYAYKLLIQSDGKIVVVGDENEDIPNCTAGDTYDHTCHKPENTKLAVVRYNSDGSLDQSFGDAGKTVIPMGENVIRYYALSSDSNQNMNIALSIYGATISQSVFETIRLKGNGALVDISKAEMGISRLDLGDTEGFAEIKSALAIKDGSILMASYMNGDANLFKLSPQLVLESKLPLPDHQIARTLVQQSDGKLLLLTRSSNIHSGDKTKWHLYRFDF